jgi:hypothetical protein
MSKASEKELRRKYEKTLIIKKSPEDERDHLLSYVLPTVELPLKTNNVATAASFRDQGPYPTCAAMTAALVKYWQEYKETGSTKLLSPWFVYILREDTTSEGMTTRDLMKILKNSGICLEDLAPYYEMKPISQEAIDDGKKRVIGGYALADSLTALKTALFLNGPQFMAVPVYNYTERMWYQRPGDEFLGGHLMEILDFDDNRRKLLYQNHWEGFGDINGRAEMDYDDFDMIWEFRSTYDAPTPIDPIPDPIPDPEPEPVPEKKSWVKWIVLGILTVGIAIGIWLSVK